MTPKQLAKLRRMEVLRGRVRKQPADANLAQSRAYYEMMHAHFDTMERLALRHSAALEALVKSAIAKETK